MNETIFHFRFVICDLGSARRRNARGSYDRGELAGFLPQFLHSLLRQQFSVDNQFDPAGRFICFLFHGSEPGNEFGFGTSPTGGAIVCPNGCATSNQLGGNSAAFGGLWQRASQFQNTQSELLGSLFQFSFIDAQAKIWRRFFKSQIKN
jgi:hypothetical protein